MTSFFKLAGYDYDEPSGDISIEHEDGGIRLFVQVCAGTENEAIDYECQEASVEHTEGIFFKAQSLMELVGRRFLYGIRPKMSTAMQARSMWWSMSRSVKPNS
ncbi:MAG: hypothetical protein IJ906_06535 [Oscillospiraceae bacterium]|nr:hypothetical protein [Oscillospiraceae bacterium]